MKKLALALLAFTNLAQASTQAPQSAIDAIENSPHIQPYQLSAKNYAGIAGYTLLGTTIGYILSICAVNVLGKRADVDFFRNPKTWHWFEQLGTAAGLSTGAAMSYCATMPHCGWTDKDRDLIDIVTKNTKEADLLKAIDRYFVNERFGRSICFLELVKISNRLTEAKRIFTRVDKKAFAPLNAIIEENIDYINNAVLTIKQQRTWLEESNSHTLANIQHTQQTQTNSNNTQTAIVVAHALSK